MNNINSLQKPLLACVLLLQLSALLFHTHAAAGDVDLSFDPGSGVDGSVTAIVLQPDGKVIVGGGGFTMVKGLLRTNLARLNADGSGDATFEAGQTMSGFAGFLTALALQADGKLLVAGAFGQTFCDESGCYNEPYGTVLRLNADGSRDQTFAAAMAEYSSVPREFRCLVPLPDGKVLVGGDFVSVNGTNRNGLVRLHANGTLDTSFDTGIGPNGPVQFVALQPDGKVLIGGRFTAFNGAACGSLARLNANGTLDGSFSSDFGTRHYRDCGGDVCYQVAFPTAATVHANGKVLVGVWEEYGQCDPFDGGCFLSQGYSVTRLNADGSSDPGFVFTNSARLQRVSGLLVQPDDRVLVRHGEFNTSRIHRLAADGSWDDSFQPEDTSGGANAAALQPDGKVIIGGTSVSVDSNNGRRLSRLNSDGSRDTTFDPGQGLERAVYRIALQPDGKVLIGGTLVVGDPYFGPASDVLAFVNGTNRHGKARLNIDGSLDSAFIPTPFHPAIEARYHTGNCLGDPRFSCLQGFVSSVLLVLSNGKVLMSGTFTTTVYGDEVFYQVYNSFLGRFSEAGGLETEFNSPDVYVSAMAQQADGKIVIGGSLTLSGTNATVARLNYDGSVDASFQLGQGPASVIALALQTDGKVVVAGANTVTRLNGNGSRDLAFGPITLSNGAARCLALQADGKILVAGSFTSVNGTNRRRIARLNASGILDDNFDPGNGPDDDVRSIASQPDGNIVVSGDFRTVNGALRPYVARVFGDAAAPSPSLNIERSNGFVTLAWPLIAAPFQLQQSTNPAQPNAWSVLTQTSVTNGSRISVTVPTSGEQKFFRLKSQ